MCVCRIRRFQKTKEAKFNGREGIVSISNACTKWACMSHRTNSVDTKQPNRGTTLLIVPKQAEGVHACMHHHISDVCISTPLAQNLSCQATRTHQRNLPHQLRPLLFKIRRLATCRCRCRCRGAHSVVRRAGCAAVVAMAVVMVAVGGHGSSAGNPGLAMANVFIVDKFRLLQSVWYGSRLLFL